MVKGVDIELIFRLVNKKGSLQRVNAPKIVIKNGLYFILWRLKKRAPHVVEIDNNCWIAAYSVSTCSLKFFLMTVSPGILGLYRLTIASDR